MTRGSVNRKVTTRSSVRHLIHLRTRKVRWVTPAPSITLVRSRSIGPVPRWSNNETPPPSRTGTRSRWISSRSPALMHCCTMLAAPTPTSLSPATALEGAFEAVGDERERRSFVDPVLWDRAANNKDRDIQRVVAIPPMGEVEGPSTEHQRPGRFAGLAQELGGLRRDPEDHVGAWQPVVGVATGVPGHEPLAAVPHGCFRAAVWPTDEPVERDGEAGADLPHVRAPLPWSARSSRTPTPASSCAACRLGQASEQL